MAMLERLSAIWATIDEESGAQPGTYIRRVPDSGALTFYASIVRPEGRKVFSAYVASAACSQLNLPFGGRGFDLVVEERPNDAMSVLHLQERSGAGETIFAMLCGDLISASKTAVDMASASVAFCNRLVAWKRFFEFLGDRGISREEYVGLWGELHFMDSIMRAGTPPADALRAWLGPVAAPQDFSFGARAVEVKTSVAAEMELVNISNVGQLDDSLLTDLHLVCCHCDFRPEAGLTISQLKADLCTRLGPGLSGPFEDALISRGLAEPDNTIWRNWGFRVVSERAFKVSEGFPRLKVKDVPVGVVDVAYSIQLGGCAEYRVDLGQVLINARFEETT